MSHTVREWTIRPATLVDAQPISELIAQSIRTLNASDYPPKEIDLICKDFSYEKIAIEIARRDVFVATCDDTLVGTVSYARHMLQSLFVAPKWQRLGLATGLVHHIEAHARSNGTRCLTLSSSLTARPLYEALGYTALHFEERDYGSTWRMQKSL